MKTRICKTGSLFLIAFLTSATVAASADVDFITTLCRPKIVTAKYVDYVLDWCDPGNYNKLQYDSYAKNAAGDKGAYLGSVTNILCTATSLPFTVKDGLC